ncbi:MAG TPA: ABC transporter permease [Patescibacteria group bacterium]|nr:ABC transporter permease [Patescibacteria group bacterium]
MIKSYLQTTLRNLKKTKLFTLINVLGLAIGMSACLFILYFVNYEKSYDRFHENSDRIFRLRYERADQDGQAVRFASCCPPAGLRIRELYPEIEKVARLFRYRASVSHAENRFFEERMYFAEADFLAIFKYEFISGDPLTGIKEPNRAFVSESTARKYFGGENAVGRTLSVDKKVDYQVAGVFKDIPPNSHLKFDILLSYPNILDLYGKEVENSWGDSGWFTYLLLKPQADAPAFEKKLPALVEAEFGEVLRAYKLTCDLKLQPLKDIHLTSNFQQEYEVNGDMDTVNFLQVIAIFIIAIAWANYTNLSTARSLTRAKEVGMRKVAGASRAQLMAQFFLETILINLLALVLALLAVKLFLPVFRQITGTPAEYGIWTQQWFWLTVLAMFVAGVFLSGMYPVLVLSSFQPARVLKGKLGNAARGMSLRKFLVVIQFVMALGLLISTFTVFRQLSFMKNQDLGFDMEQKLVIRAPRVRSASFSSTLQTFKQELLKNRGISDFCVGTDVPGKQVWWDAGGIRRFGTDDNKNYQIVGIDYDYVKVFGLKFVAGRNFSKEHPGDAGALILNETAAKWLGFQSPAAAIGQRVIYWDDTLEVIGVLADHHQQSLKHAFEPHIFRFLPEGRDVRGLFVLKLNTWEMKATIQGIRKLFNGFFPDNPFEYYFLDDYYNQQYKGDELFGKVFALFSILAIIVTGLGILGLSSFMALQRTREIGIRKVLGASTPRIMFLLAKDFLQLLAISFAIALPISYFFIRVWLQSFAVRTDLAAGLFFYPLAIVSSVTIATILAHIIKAAMANPVDSLKYE